MQDGRSLSSEAHSDASLGTPEVLAANLLEAFAAADATSQGAAPAEWTIASFGGGADSGGADEDQAGVDPSPAQHASTPVRLSELEPDGDDGSEAGSELSLLQPTPLQRGHGADTTAREASHETPGSEAAVSSAVSTERAGADFTFSAAPGTSHGPAYVSPVWGPLLRSAAPAALAAAKSASVNTGDSAITAASQPLAEAIVAMTSLSDAPVPGSQLATSEQLLARLAALEAPPAPAVVRQLRAAAEALRGEEAFAIHVAMAQVLLDRKVPWLVCHTRLRCTVCSTSSTPYASCSCNVVGSSAVMYKSARTLWEQCKRFACSQAVESLKVASALRQDQRVLFRLGGLLFGLQQYSGCRAAYQAALQARTRCHWLLLVADYFRWFHAWLCDAHWQ